MNDRGTACVHGDSGQATGCAAISTGVDPGLKQPPHSQSLHALAAAADAAQGEERPANGHALGEGGSQQTPPSSLSRGHHLNNDSLGLSSRQIFDSFLDQALSK